MLELGSKKAVLHVSIIGGSCGNQLWRTFIIFWICRQIGIVSTGKKVCLRPDESLVEQSGMMAWRFKSSHIRSKHISTYMSQQTIYPLQRWGCWDWNMGRDASKLGMIQRRILYCAQILYLKCIFRTKSRFGRSFPHMLANKNTFFETM